MLCILVSCPHDLYIFKIFSLEELQLAWEERCVFLGTSQGSQTAIFFSSFMGSKSACNMPGQLVLSSYQLKPKARTERACIVETSLASSHFICISMRCAVCGVCVPHHSTNQHLKMQHKSQQATTFAKYPTRNLAPL